MLAITVPLAANIQTIINISPPGSVFQLAAGIYRGEQFTARNGDQFLGAPAGGTRLSGAIVLDRWVAAGHYWLAAGLPPPLIGQPVSGSAPFASDRNDLFVDDAVYRRVDTLSKVASGTWYFDPVTRSAYVSIDPSGHTIEYSVTPGLTFDNGATGVVIRDLTIEKYATDAQTGPIHGVRGWQIIDVTSRQNHGAGLNIGANTTVESGHYIGNGQIGINGWHADRAAVIGAEIAGNNYAGYNTDWEAGGLKIAGSADVVIFGNNVHDNDGQGLWGDIDDRDFTYDNNTVVSNHGMGIMHEISHGHTFIRNNTISCNSGSGIYISNSDGVEVSGNTVTVGSGNGSGKPSEAIAGGIDIINDKRGAGPYGVYQSAHNRIQHNIIIHSDDTAFDGVFIYQAIAPPMDASNVFDFNRYFVRDPATPHWHFGQNSYRWQGLQDDSIAELHGQIVVMPEQMKTDCKPVRHAASDHYRLHKNLRLGIALMSIIRSLY